jgi:uncharacterized glyoxalase superfamily protein PhnB
MPQILQNHYVLAVHDLTGSSEFFQKLGFDITNEPPGWIFLQKDNCTVMLGECPNALKPSALGDHSYFAYLRVDDAAAYLEELKQRGIAPNSPLADKPWGMREFTLKSPEGHRITVGQWIGA